jgi:hypothetical protein
MGRTSKSSDLLHVEASLIRVSQSGLKTSGGAMTSGARGTITEVASESSRRRMDRCDGLHRTMLSLLYRFHSIRSHEHSSHLAFYLDL